MPVRWTTRLRWAVEGFRQRLVGWSRPIHRARERLFRWVIAPLYVLSAVIGLVLAIGGKEAAAAVCGFVFVGCLWLGPFIGKVPDD